MEIDTYKIVRFYRDPDVPNEVTQTDLTLREVREHCNSEDSHSLEEGWFDGYYKE